MFKTKFEERSVRCSKSLWLGTAASIMVLGSVFGTTVAAQAAGKDITIVLQEEPFSVEPCNANTSIIGKVLKQNIVETLVSRNAVTGEILPRLATSWEHPDDLTWIFKLRKGVKFHDGADFNADAVIYAINRTLDERINCEVRIKVFSGFTMEMTAMDNHTLKIVTSSPKPILPTMIVPLTIMSPNTPNGVMTDKPVGTGPYVFGNRVPGQEINLARFDGYWGAKPEVENAKYIWRSESSVRAVMVAKGEADLAPNIAVDDATSPKTDFPYPNSETTRLRIQVNVAPLNDKRMREALNLAIDRNALKGSVFSKDVIPATQLVPPGTNGYNNDLKVWPYDPKRARALIAEAKAAGVPVDAEITLYGRTGVYPHSTESLEAIMAMLIDVGFNIKLKMLEVAQHVTYLQKPFPTPILPNMIQDQHDNANGDAVFTVFYKYGSKGANSVLRDKHLDEVIEGASAAVGDKRAKLWNEAFKIVESDHIADVMLFHMVGYARVNERINFKPTIKTNSEVDIEDITFAK